MMGSRNSVPRTTLTGTVSLRFAVPGQFAARSPSSPRSCASMEFDVIDVLKMDIEGSEYAAIEDLCRSEIYPKQLLVEFHHNSDLGIQLQKTRDAVAALRASGILCLISRRGAASSRSSTPRRSTMPGLADPRAIARGPRLEATRCPEPKPSPAMVRDPGIARRPAPSKRHRSPGPRCSSSAWLAREVYAGRRIGRHRVRQCAR
jgi:hypothetical protein